LWGLWHGLGLVFLHLLADAQRRHPRLREIVQRGVGDMLAVALTFAFVTIGWTVFFLPPSDALSVLASALRWRGGPGPATTVPLFVMAALVIGHLAGGSLRDVWARTPRVLRWSAESVLAGLLTYALFLTSTGRQGFVYTQF
jgi:hypothetical protein